MLAELSFSLLFFLSLSPCYITLTICLFLPLDLGDSGSIRGDGYKNLKCNSSVRRSSDLHVFVFTFFVSSFFGFFLWRVL